MKPILYTAAAFFGTAFGLLTAAPLNLDKAQVAIQGYDPVSYFTVGEPARGQGSLAASYLGATYLFSSSAHKSLFINDPEAYVPEYGGYCAFGVGRGKLLKVDPQAFTIYRGRLFLQYNKSVAEDYAYDLSTNIAISDKKWITLSK